MLHPTLRFSPFILAIVATACANGGSRGSAVPPGSADGGPPAMGADASPDTDAGATAPPDAGVTTGPVDSGATISDAGSGSADDAGGGASDAGALSGCSPRDLGSMMGIGIATGSTVGASDDVSPSCGAPSPDAILRWVAPRAGSFAFDTIDSDFDTLISVRTASCSGTELGCNDDDVGLQSRVDVSLTAGAAVVVSIDGYSGDTGDYVLSITETVGTETLCSNSLDDDRDGDADCDDSDCSSACTPAVPRPGAAGDVVVSEVLQNPSGSDAGREWLELHNPTSTAYNLNGCVLSDLGVDRHTISADVMLAPGGYVTMSSGTSPGFTPDYTYSGYILANGDDEVVLTCSGTMIDRVVYDGGPSFPDPDGASMSLGSGAMSHTQNDLGASWCASPASMYDGTNRGTPGAGNPACP